MPSPSGLKYLGLGTGLIMRTSYSEVAQGLQGKRVKKGTWVKPTGK